MKLTVVSTVLPQGGGVDNEQLAGAGCCGRSLLCASKIQRPAPPATVRDTAAMKGETHLLTA
jgi:hypothetical protein